jgi:hypothetical protein
MAIKFADAKGSAGKGKIDSYVYKDGDNKVRLVGDILARYVYWVKGENNKDIPFECLAFDRGLEKFTNSETDWVKKYYPDLKCSWAYSMQCIDEGKVKIINLKKKLLEQIMIAAEDLGDPTDPDTGWDVMFRKQKTGPLPINVEYTLQSLKCKTRELSDEDKALVAELRSMDDIVPRPTPEAQKELLDKIKSGNTGGESIDEEIADEFTVS